MKPRNQTKGLNKWGHAERIPFRLAIFSVFLSRKLYALTETVKLSLECGLCPEKNTV